MDNSNNGARSSIADTERTALPLLRTSFASVRSRFQAIADRGLECKAWLIEVHDHDAEVLFKRINGLKGYACGIGVGAYCDFPRMSRNHFQECWQTTIMPLADDASRLICQLPISLWDKLWAGLPNGATPHTSRSDISPWLWPDAVFELAFQDHEGSPLRAERNIDGDTLTRKTRSVRNSDSEIQRTQPRSVVFEGFPDMPRVMQAMESLNHPAAMNVSWYATINNFAAASVNAIDILMAWLAEGKTTGGTSPLPPVTDGPFGLNGFRWGTLKPRIGLPSMPFRLLTVLWAAKDRTAAFRDLANSVWDDGEINLRNDNRLGSARRAVNDFMKAGAFPFRVRTSSKNEVVTLIESTGQPAAPPKSAAGKKARRSPRPARQ